MQIHPATCPACGEAYDPLRANAVSVIDGRVRAFCSAACRERGLTPPAPKPSATDTHSAIVLPTSSPPSRGLPAEQRVLVLASTATLAAFVLLIALGRHKATAAATTPAAVRTASTVHAPKAAIATDDTADVWLQPLARVGRAAVKRDPHLFAGREGGLPPSECGGGVRCSVEIDATAGAVVMAVHDGVIEAVERRPDGRAEGRFVRIIHKGGEYTSSYLQLDGIREDLRPGIPVKAGEPIGTVARAPNASTRPHFRFAMSVSNGADGATLFIDPQSLLAIWPTRHDATISLRAMEHASEPVEEPAEPARTAAGRADPTDHMR